MIEHVPPTWAELFEQQSNKPYFKKLARFIKSERKKHTVYPLESDVFKAFELTALNDIRVVLLGQDPYHGEGQAHGLCFSVPTETKPPPSLANVFKELNSDLGCPIPNHGSLTDWAAHGVLLLNTVLTVQAGKANSHRSKGWETFTDAVIQSINDSCNGVVFMLWGKPAQQKAALVDQTKHAIVESSHPSPLAARYGFLGSRPFSRTNEALTRMGHAPVNWTIHNV